jgi:hypothetical protein
VAYAALTGLRPSLVLIAVGLAGMLFCLALLRGTYATIVQVKVPQRLQGRVFAVADDLLGLQEHRSRRESGADVRMGNA